MRNKKEEEVKELKQKSAVVRNKTLSMGNKSFHLDGDGSFTIIHPVKVDRLPKQYFN